MNPPIHIATEAAAVPPLRLRCAIAPRLRPHHFGISVPDLQAALDWYEHMLGFELESRLAIDAIPAQIAFVRRDGFRIEIFEVTGAEPLPPARRIPERDLHTHGNKHMCFAVGSVRETVAALRDKGADIALEREIHGNPMAFVRDVAGNLIEFVEAFSSASDMPPV